MSDLEVRFSRSHASLDLAICVSYIDFMPTKKKKKKEEWRSLCKLITKESDPQRLSELIDQLIKELDAREQTLRAMNNQQKIVSISAPSRKSRK